MSGEAVFTVSDILCLVRLCLLCHTSYVWWGCVYCFDCVTHPMPGQPVFTVLTVSHILCLVRLCWLFWLCQTSYVWWGCVYCFDCVKHPMPGEAVLTVSQSYVWGGCVDCFDCVTILCLGRLCLLFWLCHTSSVWWGCVDCFDCVTHPLSGEAVLTASHILWPVRLCLLFWLCHTSYDWWGCVYCFDCVTHPFSGEAVFTVLTVSQSYVWWGCVYCFDCVTILCLVRLCLLLWLCHNPMCGEAVFTVLIVSQSYVWGGCVYCFDCVTQLLSGEAVFTVLTVCREAVFTTCFDWFYCLVYCCLFTAPSVSFSSQTRKYSWSGLTMLCAATLRYNLQIKFAISLSQSFLTPGRPVPVLTLYYQAPGRVATRVPTFQSLVWLDPGKRGSNSVPPALWANTWPPGQPSGGLHSGMVSTLLTRWWVVQRDGQYIAGQVVGNTVGRSVSCWPGGG